MSFRFRTQVLWVVLSNAVYAMCQWLILVSVARIGGVAEVGELAFALAIITPVALFTDLGLREAFATDASSEFSFHNYFVLRVFMVGSVLTCGAAILLAGGVTSVQFAWVLLAVGVSKAAESISDIYYGAMQRESKLHILAVSRIVRSLAGVAVFATVYYFTSSLGASFAGLATIWFVCWACIDRRYVSSPRRSTADMVSLLATEKALFFVALPLGIATFLASLKTSVPRFFIGELITKEELGLFAAFAYVFVVLGLVVNAICLAASPRLADAARDRSLKEFLTIGLKIALAALLIGVLGTVSSVVFGEELIGLLYGYEFVKSVEILIAVSVVGLISYLTTTANCMVNALRCFRQQLMVSGGALIVIVAGCVLLVPLDGARGAAVAWGVGLTVHLMGAVVVVSKRMGKIRRE